MRSHRLMISTGVVTSAVLVGGGGVVAERAAAGSDVVRVHAVLTKTEATDMGPKGVGIGDRLAYTVAFSEAGNKGKKLGTGYGECVRLTGSSDAAGVLHCSETIRLKGGDLYVGGIYAPGAKSNTWTITGGTGRYRGSTGEEFFRTLDATSFAAEIRFGD